MPLDDIDRARVAATRALFADPASGALRAFHASLFEIAPEVRDLFPRNLAGQSRKLGDTLVLAIDHLGDTARLEGYDRAFGELMPPRARGPHGNGRRMRA